MADLRLKCEEKAQHTLSHIHNKTQTFTNTKPIYKLKIDNSRHVFGFFIYDVHYTHNIFKNKEEKKK